MDFTVATKELQLLVDKIPVSDLVGIATFLILPITIFISFKALRETSRANILSYLPVLVLEYVVDNSVGKPQGDKVVVRNIGHGAAVSIKVDNYYISYIDDMSPMRKAQHLRVKFGSVDLLQPNTSRPLETLVSNPSFIGEDLVIYRIFNHDSKITFHIRYSDVSGTRYISKIRISRSKIEVMGVPKKFNILRNFLYRIFLLSEKFILIFRRLQAEKEQREFNMKIEDKDS